MPQEPIEFVLLDDPTEVVEEEKKKEPPSKMRRAGAAVTRGASSILGSIPATFPGLGSAAGFAIGGAGELAAQAIEEDASLKDLMGYFSDPTRMGRAALEGGVTAVPFSWMIKGGKLGTSMLRSGGLAGAGEYAREKLRGEDPSLASVGLSTGLGAATGGIMSRFIPDTALGLPKLGAPVPKGPSGFDELVTTLGNDIPAFRKSLPAVMRQEGWGAELNTILSKAKAVEASGQEDLANAIREEGLNQGFWDPKAILAEAKAIWADGDISDALSLAQAANKTRKGGQGISVWLDQKRTALKAASEAATTKAEKKRLAALAATATKKKIDELKEAGAKESISVTESSSYVDPLTGETKKVSTSIKPKGADDTLEDVLDLGGAGSPTGAAPIAPVPGSPTLSGTTGVGSPIPGSLPTPKMGTYQVVGRSGVVIKESTDPIEIQRFIEKYGPGSFIRVVDPAEIVAIREASKATRATGKTTPTEAPVPTTTPETPVIPVQGDVPVATASPTLPVEPTNPAFVASKVDGEEAGNIAMDAARVQEVLGRTPEQALAEGLITSQEIPKMGTMYRLVPKVATSPVVPAAVAQTPEVASAAAPIISNAPPVPPVIPDVPVSSVAPIVDAPVVPAAPVAPVDVAPSTIIPETPVTPEAVAPEVLSTGKPAKVPVPLKPTKTEKIDPYKVLAPEDINAITDDTILKKFSEVGTPEADEAGVRVAELSRQYREAKLSGKPTMVLGAQLRELGQELEKSGVVPEGFNNQLSKEIKEALSEVAFLRKDAEIDLAAGARPGSTARPPTPEETASFVQRGEAEGLYPDAMPQTGVAQVVDAVDDTGIPQSLTDKAAQFREAVATGAVDPETAAKTADEIQRELLEATVAQAVKEEGGTYLGMSGGGAMGVLKKYPQTAVKALLIAGGALTGAVTDPLDDQVLSTLLGAGAGWSAAKVGANIKAARINLADNPELAGALQSGDKSMLAEAGKTLYQIAPHFQRANYLWSTYGLPFNAWVGPWGTGFFGAATKALSGDPRGGRALHEIMRPAHWFKEYAASYAEANDLIARAAAGDPLLRAELHGDVIEKVMAQANKWVGKAAGQTVHAYLQGPGVAMAMGDIATRRMLLRAGFSMQEAKVMTLTSEPAFPVLQNLMNSRRVTEKDPIFGPLFSGLFPFVRTPLNILEQGLERMPGLGFLVHGAKEGLGKGSTPYREQVVQQAISSILATGSFFAGLASPEEMQPILRRAVSNVGGQYSLISGLAYAAGTGARRDGGGPNDFIDAVEWAIPLPTTEPITRLLRYGSALVQGKDLPSAPPGSIPFRELFVDPTNPRNIQKSVEDFLELDESTYNALRGIR